MAIGAFGGAFALVQLGALLAVLVAGLALLGRRLPGGSTTRSVRLTQQHAVHLVELGGRSFVVGTGPGAAPRLLVELNEAVAEAEGSQRGD